jgi:hypothetical protein
VIQRGPGEPLKPLRHWFKEAFDALLWLEAELDCCSFEGPPWW